MKKEPQYESFELQPSSGHETSSHMFEIWWLEWNEVKPGSIGKIQKNLQVGPDIHIIDISWMNRLAGSRQNSSDLGTIEPGSTLRIVRMFESGDKISK